MNPGKINLIKGEGALYIQLYRQLKDLIINRELKDKEKLPAIRELATQLEVNNVTVINAYRQLEKDGLVIKKVGSGSFINFTPSGYKTSALDFTGRDSNIDNFPLEEIKNSINYVLEVDGAEAFRYEGTKGYPKLRDSLKEYFNNFNISVDKQTIQIVSGGQQALDIISKALLEYGETVITEEPSYKGAIDCFKSREARVIQIPLESDGLDLVDLELKIKTRRPSFIYLMPYNQKPTGINYSLNKKKKLIELANIYNFYIVEDDLGSEIDLGSDNTTIKSIDSYDRVIYIKSFTPLFMPGLRLGCIIPPSNLYQKFLNIKRTTDISTPGLLQRGFTHYLNKKSWISYFKTVSNSLLDKINLTNSILDRDFGELITYEKPTLSPCYWLKLHKGRASSLTTICSELGVQIIPGDTIGEDYNNYFRINIKSIPYNNIERGLELLKNGIITLYSKKEEKNIYL